MQLLCLHFTDEKLLQERLVPCTAVASGQVRPRGGLHIQELAQENLLSGYLWALGSDVPNPGSAGPEQGVPYHQQEHNVRTFPTPFTKCWNNRSFLQISLKASLPGNLYDITIVLRKKILWSNKKKTLKWGHLPPLNSAEKAFLELAFQTKKVELKKSLPFGNQVNINNIAADKMKRQ